MAGPNGIFNIVKISSISYADADTSLGVIPVMLTSLTSLIKDGSVNCDFPEPSVTTEYDEINQGAFRVRTGAVQNKVSIDLVAAKGKELGKFWGKAFVEGSTPTDADKIMLGRSSAVNKYVKITGINTNGKEVTLELLNAKPVTSWSGNLGENQETLGQKVTFYLMQSADGSGYEASFSSK